jgi:hypothetical protein
MTKKTKILIVVSVLVITLLAFYLLYKNGHQESEVIKDKEHQTEIMTQDERRELGLYSLGVYEVVSRDEKGEITSYKMVRLLDEEPIGFELMSENDKAVLGVATDAKIQVLKRDESGKVVSYKILKNDSDIVKKY